MPESTATKVASYTTRWDTIVFQVIDGRALVSGHGARDMPVWGNRYQEDIGNTYGPYGGEQAVRARVLELVYYIQSIQK